MHTIATLLSTGLMYASLEDSSEKGAFLFFTATLALIMNFIVEMNR